MRNIIYSKFSNERADKFKLRTDILINEEGRRIVRKMPLTTQASTHIIDIYNSYNLLTEMYKDSRIHINKCYRESNTIEFEYIEGNTLEEELDELLEIKGYKEFIERIIKFIEDIEINIGSKFFQPTKKFIDIFGNVNLPKSLKAADINNIDLIFSNIIVGKKLQVIDYEWTFDFPIPFNFIIYRAIYYYIDGLSKRKENFNLDLYEFLGISKQEIRQYEIMEQNFQKYVLGDLVPLRDLNISSLKNNINIKKIIEWEKSEINMSTIQIYLDYGSGFNENDSYKINIPISNDGKVNFEIPLTLKVEKVRIDPGNTQCIVNVNNLTGDNGKFYKLKFNTNGKSVSENTILFSTIDPQIILNDIEMATTKIEVDIEVKSISKEISIQLYESIKQKDLTLTELNDELTKSIDEKKVLEDKAEDIERISQEMKQKIMGQNLIIDKLYSEINLLETQLNDIKESKSWKFIQKINEIWEGKEKN